MKTNNNSAELICQLIPVSRSNLVGTVLIHMIHWETKTQHLGVQVTQQQIKFQEHQSKSKYLKMFMIASMSPDMQQLMWVILMTIQDFDWKQSFNINKIKFSTVMSNLIRKGDTMSIVNYVKNLMRKMENRPHLDHWHCFIKTNCFK